MRHAITLALSSIATCAAAASAQQAPGAIGAGATYANYSFRAPAQIGIESLSLLSVPASLRVRLANPLALSVSTVWARGNLVRDDGSESTIEGFTDTEIRLQLALGRDLVALTAVALLPTGVESLTFEEADVAGAIASDLFPFRISNWGSGGGAGFSAAVARALGSFGVGLNVGYIVAREYEPLQEDAFAYRPGSELKVRGVIDHTFGTAGKAALVLTFQHFDTDEVNGENLFRSGQRYEAVGSYAFAVGGRGAGILYAGYLHRETGEFLDQPEFLPAEDLGFVGGGVELSAGAVLVTPVVDLRLLRRDDVDSQGFTATAGIDAEIGLGAITFAPRFRGRLGNVRLRPGAESRFSGFDVGFAIRFGRGTQ